MDAPLAANANTAKAKQRCHLPAHMFRAYDIRGVAGEDLTKENARLLGQAIGYLAMHFGHPEVLFARDGRLSSPLLAEPLQAGILDSGCNIIDLGIVPTPLLYFATHTTECSAGVMLTASHNPAHYNGIKMVRHRASLSPEQIQGVREQAIYLARHPDRVRPADQPKGEIRQLNIIPDYLKRICQDIPLERPPKLVVDCANAVPGLVAPDLYRAMGCEVIELYCEIDGRFPNHPPDPTIASNLDALCDRVKAEGADLGIALDGDGDRIVIVSETGEILDTDRLLMLFVRDILPRYQHRPQKAHVVFDVKCSNLLSNEIESLNGVPVMSRSGHSFMKMKMFESQAVIGGEFSAHIFIKDRWYGHDDGLYAGARFMELLVRSGEPVSALIQTLPDSVHTPELRIDVEEAVKFNLMARIAEAADFRDADVNLLDGVRADFKDGWGLIRASNTTPALLLRFEAASEVALQRIQASFQALLNQIDPALKF
ncbi:phosphomannomutase/phosphoglucomutase [Pseudohongiella nitratireducens]|uniref:phosphomannomutase n=1 Tax=Pseudohongiella nitratireducens TaxID=1768907 RepID=A0A917GM27_9GAMM|nr:phosphomannomutase/phosphoglucomutase [Pseudohongiella nitratireducens]MDF1622063.1 phosphomannomutase/phosphoglucomutase [Pseudohongiella nitratireducens]GGG51686.1 phosphomannomutase/phosphoglucomutase [Pseudohongiella nitratireducens]